MPAELSPRLLRPDRRALFFISIGLAAVVHAHFEFWNLPTEGDRAIFNYFARLVANGGVPYRDAVDIKTPLSVFIAAATVVATEPLGLRDLFAIRLTYILLGILTVGFAFIVAHDYFRSKRIAVLTVLIMLAFPVFAKNNSEGVEAKTPMLLFGLLALWAIYHQRPFLSGLFGMLSALSIQP